MMPLAIGFALVATINLVLHAKGLPIGKKD